MKLRHTLSLALTAALLILAAGQPGSIAVATPINYDELVDSELPPTGSPLPTLAFDLGTNTVSGSVFVDEIADFDSFAFTVPAGAQLISGQVSVTETDGNFDTLNWNFFSGSANSGTVTLLEPVSVASPGLTAFTAVPLGPGVYNLTFDSFGGDIEQPAFADYIFTFELQAVPEPGAVSLLTTGLLGALAWRRRRRR